MVTKLGSGIRIQDSVIGLRTPWRSHPLKKGGLGDLLKAFPNPFNPSTALSYQLSANSYVTLKVYDTAGRLVATLVDGWRKAGRHEATFDGSKLPSGIYLYTLSADEHTATGKIVLLK